MKTDDALPQVKTRWRVVAAVLTIVLMGGLILAFRHPEPSYEGRKLSEWLKTVDSPRVNARPRTLEAVRSMGKPAAPILARIVTQRDNFFHKTYRSIYPRLPLRVQRGLPGPHRFWNRRAFASQALCELGSNALEVLPLIIRATDAQSDYLSMNVLARCAPNTSFASNAVEVLIQLTKDPDMYSRSAACSSLGYFTNFAPKVIPVLIAGLTDSQPVRDSARNALVQIGKPAVPALIEAAKKEHGFTRPAELALEQIDPKAAEAVKSHRLTWKGPWQQSEASGEPSPQ